MCNNIYGGVSTVIYVDVLIFVNIIINYLILSITKRYLHIDAKVYRLIISSVVSSLSSLLIFLKVYNEIYSFSVKLLVCVIMVFIAFKLKSFKEFYTYSVTLFIVTVIFSGFMITIYNVFKPQNMFIINDIIYFEFNPIVMIAISFIIYLIVLLITKLFSEKVKNTIVHVKIYINEHEYYCKGKIDTGCNAVEPFSGSPIIIVEKSILNTDNFEFKRIVPYKTVNGESIMYAVKAQKVEIDKENINKEIYIGSVNSIDKDIKAIINSEIIR